MSQCDGMLPTLVGLGALGVAMGAAVGKAVGRRQNAKHHKKHNNMVARIHAQDHAQRNTSAIVWTHISPYHPRKTKGQVFLEKVRRR